MSQPSTMSKRRQSLQGYIQKVVQHLDTDSLTHRSMTLRALLQSLSAFGSQQLDFLESLYQSDQSLSLSELYPSEYVLNTTLQQIGFDLDVLVRAYSQRALDLGALTEKDGSQCYLRLADTWTYWALKPVMKWGDSVATEQQLVAESTVMTYFQKSTNVRLIPYAPAVLIGIPFSAIDNAFDLLAIPHEVGHYIYHSGCWQGQFVETWLDEQLQTANLPDWAWHWAEECFADVYGCLIAGKHIAESALEMARTASLDEYFEDDGEHPIPALRPLIYAAVLEKLSGLDQEEVTDFRSQWESLRGQRPLQELLRVHASSTTGRMISQAEIGNALRQMVAVILNLPPLCRLAQSTSRLEQGVWAYSLQEMEAAQLEQAVDTTLPELITDGDELVIAKDADGALIPLRKLGVTPHDELRIELRTALGNTATSEAIKSAFDRVIDFGGWTVKGPIGKTH